MQFLTTIFQCLLLTKVIADYQGHKVVQIAGYGKKQDKFLETLDCDVWAVDEKNSMATVRLSPCQYATVMAKKDLFRNVTTVDHDLQGSLDMDAAHNTLSKSVKVRTLSEFLVFDMFLG